MTTHHINLKFVVTASPAEGARPNELARTMAPHPLIYQELLYNPKYTIYNRRLAWRDIAPKACGLNNAPRTSGLNKRLPNVTQAILSQAVNHKQ